MFVVRLLITLTAFFVSLPVAGKSYEYISLDEAKKLEKTFKASQTPSLEKLTSQQWNCSLFGMRTRFQVDRDLQLYVFEKASSTKVVNKGSHRFRSYTKKDGAFLGKKGPLMDLIRMTDDGQLISEVTMDASLPNAKSKSSAVKALDKSRVVVAYGLCDPVDSTVAKN